MYQHIKIAFRPDDRNHLVIINGSDEEVHLPITFNFSSESSQTITFGHGTLPAASESIGRALVVYTFPHAFFSGTLTINDADGQEWQIDRFGPPGRYCGSLVVVFQQNAQVIHSFNGIPALEETVLAVRPK